MSEFNQILNQKAVALSYDEEKQSAPVVVACGKGYLAEKITELAIENGVPVYEDHSLANVLSQLNVGEQIPQELYQAIVDIYVYFLGFVPDKPEKSGNFGQEDFFSRAVEMTAWQEEEYEQ